MQTLPRKTKAPDGFDVRFVAVQMAAAEPGRIGLVSAQRAGGWLLHTVAAVIALAGTLALLVLFAGGGAG